MIYALSTGLPSSVCVVDCVIKCMCGPYGYEFRIAFLNDAIFTVGAL